MGTMESVKGISLIALVVAVVVVLILAGMTYIIANQAMINKASEAVDATIDASQDEQTEMAWVEGRAEVFPLKGNVKVGDYIEYDVSYQDTYSGQSYRARDGWKVIDDGVMNGTSGKVRIISVGIPMIWDYNPDELTSGELAVEQLINHFEELSFIFKNDEENVIKGSTFKIESICEKVTTLTLSDFNFAYNKLYGTSRESKDTTSFTDDKSLLSAADNYWLATNKRNNIYFVYDNSIISGNDLGCGIRPVICLKDDLTGIFYSDVWKIVH